MAASCELEKYWEVIAAIHTVAASPERWPEAVRAVARLASASEENRFMLASFDRLGLAAFIVAGDGAVIERNAIADRVLEDAGVTAGRRGLCFALLATNSEFADALRRATGAGVHSSRISFPVRRTQHCELAVSPVNANLALVVIAPPRAEERAPLQRVRRRYGLTDAETRVTAALSSGGSVGEIARDHGVRVSTVRAQLRSIFDKTGVTRQSDLVRLSLSR